jgi:hypothetical protein
VVDVVEWETSHNGNGDGNGARARRVDASEPAPVDLPGTAGAPMLRRLVPVGVVLVVLALWSGRRRRRRRARRLETTQD